MAVLELRNYRVEGVEQIQISSGIEVGDRQGGGGVQNKQMANAASILEFGQLLFTELGNIDYLAFSLCEDFEFCHGFSLSFGLARSMLTRLTNRVAAKTKDTKSERAPTFGRLSPMKFPVQKSKMWPPNGRRVQKSTVVSTIEPPLKA